MRECDTRNIVARVIRDVAMRDDLVVDHKGKTNELVGWDSFKQISLIVDLENEFNIQFTSDEVTTMVSIEEISRTILAKLTS